MFKYQLSKSSNPRKHSPLAYIDFNVPERISPDKFSKLKLQPANRTKRILSHVENPTPPPFINTSHHHQANSLSRPRLAFSAKGKTITHRPSSTKGNLMTTVSIKAKCGMPVKHEVNPFHLNLQFEAKLSMTEKDFLKIKQLGRGKFGTVWLAIHKKTNFLCALKIISKSVVREQKVVHQVAKQLRIHNNMKHRNVINFFGFFEQKDYFYIITEYATQGNVFGRLKQCHRLQETEVKEYTIQTVEGLKYVHNRGFIHRDIKPQNLLLQFGVVKICDFGWAAECSADHMRQSQCGTPLYYSPEIVKKEAYNQKIDVWSVGLLAYELIVGRVPFKIWSEFDLPVILRQEVSIPEYVDFSQQLNSFILMSLAKDQGKRPNITELQRHPFLRVTSEQTFQSELWIQMSSIF